MRHPFFVMPSNTYKNPSQPGYIGDDTFESYWNKMATAGGSDDIIERFLMPGQAQKQEWAQQMVAQQYQNQWNSEGERLKRLVEAGVNPNLAVSAVAGAGNAPGVSPPNSAAGSGAAGVGAAAQGLQSIAGAAEAGANVYQKLTQTPTENERLKAETVSLLETAFHNHWLAVAVAEMLPYQKENMNADTWLKIANYDNTRAEYDNIKLEYDKKKSEIDEIKQQIKYYEQLGQVAKAEELRIQAQTSGIELDNWWKETEKTFWEIHGYRLDDDMHQALRHSISNGNTESGENIGKSLEEANYKLTRGKEKAESEFAAYKANIESQKAQLVQMCKTMLENPKDIRGWAAKFLNMLSTLGTVSVLEKNNVVSKSEIPN